MKNQTYYDLRDRTDDGGKVIADLFEITEVHANGRLKQKIENCAVENVDSSKITEAISQMERQINAAEEVIERSLEQLDKLEAAKLQLAQRQSRAGATGAVAQRMLKRQQAASE